MGIELKTKSGNITLTAPKASGGGSVDLSNYYTKDQTDAKIQEVVDAIPEVDFTGYATETYVQEKINEIDFPETDLSNYYNKDQVDAAIDGAIEEIPEVDLSGYAKKEEIPDVSGFLTNVPEEYITETELEGKGYLTEHQSLEGYAKTEDIPDVSVYYTKEEIDGLLANITPSDIANVEEVLY